VSSPEAAELSSLSTALDDLTRRVTAIAERRGDVEGDDVAASLFEVERALREARRRLSRLVDSL
jgi:hypothetical protein